MRFLSSSAQCDDWQCSRDCGVRELWTRACVDAVHWTRTALVAIMVLAGALVVAPSPASADYQARCFYPGVFRDGSSILRVDLNNDGTTDKCFGIAPNRTIWNSWPRSNGWWELPNNGRADDVCSYDVGTHTLFVIVNGYRGLWSTSWNATTRKWIPWQFRSGWVCVIPDRPERQFVSREFGVVLVEPVLGGGPPPIGAWARRYRSGGSRC
jgi:hypothetical protein